MAAEKLHRLEMEPIEDHCGIVGILSSQEMPLFEIGRKGLIQLQTRGYDGAGYAAFRSDGTLLLHKAEGTIRDVFNGTISSHYDIWDAYAATFQVRYGTSGGFVEDNVQPLVSRHISGDRFMLAHNGQFSKNNGYNNSFRSDTVDFSRKLACAEGNTWEERILNSSPKGAWSLIINTEESMYLYRDPFGIRPLFYAQEYLDDKNAIVTVAASETTALNEMGFCNHFEVLPGELLRFDRNEKGFTVCHSSAYKQSANCMFENVYTLDEAGRAHIPRANRREVERSISVKEFRRRCGYQLALEAPISKDEADIVIGIPGTAISGGEAYAEAVGIPYVQAIEDQETPEHEQRTFMQGEVNDIYLSVLNHFRFREDLLQGKRIVLVDDSLVRGNISRGIIEILRKLEEIGVDKIHFRVLSPPIDKPCYLGINTRTEAELIIARHLMTARREKVPMEKQLAYAIELTRQEIKADSLAYLSGEGLVHAAGENLPGGFCMGCMAGYSSPIDRHGNIIYVDSI